MVSFPHLSSQAAVVAHGGGPTTVLNASLAGVVAGCVRTGIGPVYGARFGANGLVSGEFVELPSDATILQRLAAAPGSAIGSSRRKLEPEDYQKTFENLHSRGIAHLFYTGGNGSMETALRLHRFARDSGSDVRVVGVPKTIDNDIGVTDHTPGYASCARFFAHVVRDVGEDNRALPPPIQVIEVLGRNVGWVVAATALARQYEDDAPHLIYVPER
jgi:6-phosphofructokinase 1